MHTNDFNFTLPPELIAQYPAERRSASRLLCLDAVGKIGHRWFVELPQLLRAGDLLVFNDTRVIPARLFGVKASGGKVEILVERVLDAHQVLAHIGASKAPKPGCLLLLDGGVSAIMVGRQGDLFKLQFDGEQNAIDILEKFGHMPLPPYIERQDESLDQERYQTVFAKRKGAVAAPTAGLHFDQEILTKLQNKGVETAFITLHVGAGTFQPVRVANIKEHKMHAEYVEVSAAVGEQINRVKARGNRVIAVGTTCVRSLETAARSGTVKPFAGETDIFIYPGFKFNCIDGMITNFHLPKSTLLMLVCAFAGIQPVLRAYQEAVNQQYRFFSYGDAMLVTK